MRKQTIFNVFKSPISTGIVHLTWRAIYFFLCCVREKKNVHIPQTLQYSFSGKVPKGGKKHRCPVFVTLWDEMRNGEWCKEGTGTLRKSISCELCTRQRRMGGACLVDACGSPCPLTSSRCHSGARAAW